ncbi:MAG: N-acetylgalactosamine-6-sulfatase [Chitinophagaceae bacterium]|nr:MAG: N-acetylgalactosamine-6-sulfatase [Chitinophagaceae bacterium]
MKSFTTLLAFLCIHYIVSAQASKPNIIFILTDDMGYGDISCFNGLYPTPGVDRMAAEGTKFTNYYSAAPVCSPSRAGFLTSMAPAKWKINNYLSDKKHNATCEQNDFLDPAAPSIAKVFKAAGYKTGHFGKWHMGGGRDVKNAPSIGEYGFDEWNSTWESPDPDPLLTSGNWIWSDTDSVKRWNRTAYFVDKTLEFLKKNKGTPCYINLWPDDVHTPWVPGDDYVRSENESEKSFKEVLKDYDTQINRLLDSLKATGLDKNTIVVFTSDNGPAPNFRQDRSAGMRGAKVSLYEGGIRMPFVIWAPGRVPAGKTDSASVVVATDLAPSFAKLAGISYSGKSDGEDRSAVLKGRSASRKKPIFWEYGRNDISFRYPKEPNRSPTLAVRDGKWKLLMNRDGSNIELYDIDNDKNEKNNIADLQKTITKKLAGMINDWYAPIRSMK